MNPGQPIRLPLQIGTSSIWSLARAAASLLSGPALATLAMVAFLQGRLSFWLAAPLTAAGVLLFFFALAHIDRAVRDRPSDVVLSAEGLLIEGGRYGGFTVPWSEIDRGRCVLTTDNERRLTLLTIGANSALAILAVLFETVPDALVRANVEVLRLHVARKRKGKPLPVAEAERPIEMESLRALFDSIQADHWYREADAEPRPTPAPPEPPQATLAGLTIVACQACGAPAVPDDAETVTCPYCGGEIAIPPDLRKAVQDSRAVRHERRFADKLVARLVTQPGARRTSALVGLAAIPMMLAWPLALWITLVWRQGGTWWQALQRLTLWGALPPAVFALSAVLALFFLLRSRLADRFALRLLTLGFAARAPERPGAPYTCRRCGAPLADPQDTALAPCVYCGTDNVVGIDLGHRVELETQQAGTLAEALRRRGEERRLWSSLTLAALVLLAADGLFLSRGLAGALWPSMGASRVMVSGLIQPVALAVDGDAIYWTDLGDARGHGTIKKATRSGGTKTLLKGQPFPAGIAVDENNVYWVDSVEGAIRRMPKRGGPATVLASGEFRADALVLFDGRPCWTNVNSPHAADGSIRCVSPDGAAPQVVASGFQEQTSIAVDTSDLYWTRKGTVMRAARTGVPSSVFAQDEEDVSAVAADEASVYWADRGGLILRVEKGHPAIREVLARGQGAVLAMAVDRSDVYWITAAGTIVRRHK
jgi:DNA-directed RNA polymerase subunit RPC12/RpoP